MLRGQGVLLGDPMCRSPRWLPLVALAETYQEIVDSLPDDWTDLELDMRIADESRYVEAALYLATCNARPYSHHDWHWRLPVAHRLRACRLGADGARRAASARRSRHRGRARGARDAERAGGGHADVGAPAVPREEFRRLRAQ